MRRVQTQNHDVHNKWTIWKLSRNSFFLPWLVDDEVNGKPKKEPECCVCRAACCPRCYSKFFGRKKRSACLHAKCQLVHGRFLPTFWMEFSAQLSKLLPSSLSKFQYDTNRFVDLTPILTRTPRGRLIFKCVIEKCNENDRSSTYVAL